LKTNGWYHNFSEIISIKNKKKFIKDFLLFFAYGVKFPFLYFFLKFTSSFSTCERKSIINVNKHHAAVNLSHFGTWPFLLSFILYFIHFGTLQDTEK